MMSDVNIAVNGSSGRITLARPKALHALTTAMCQIMTEALEAWWHDDNIARIVVTAEESRAFCAGGDIREALALAQNANPQNAKQDANQAGDYFACEYGMHMLIAAHPKPLITIADGLVMGGGAGLLFHARHPLVTENIDFTMPEAGIGLFPDVGASLFLRRASGHLGLYVALTGTRIGVGDVVASGLLPDYIASADVPNLVAELENLDAEADCEAVIAPYRRHDAGGGALMPHIDWIDEILSLPSLESVRDKALESTHELAPALADALTRRCPLSLKVAHHLLTGAVPDGYISALMLDYALAWRMMDYGDFAEGVRAAVVDKDQNPIWTHKSLEEVGDADIDSLFAETNRPSFAYSSLLRKGQ